MNMSTATPHSHPNLRPASSSDALAAALSRDDLREAAGMHPDDRATCHTHQSWAEDCVDHPMHTDPHGWVLRELNTRAVVS